jgi:hypothetical protein
MCSTELTIERGLEAESVAEIIRPKKKKTNKEGKKEGKK